MNQALAFLRSPGDADRCYESSTVVEPESPNGPTDGEEDLRSRTDARRERKQSEEELMQLGKTLVDLKDRLLAKVSLPDAVRAALREARRIRDPAPHYRALRVVRVALRDADVAQIRLDLKNLEDPSRGATPFDALMAWQTRLLSGGDVALDSFIQEVPGADRRQLRQLVRNVKKSTEAQQAESLRALTKLLRKHLG